MSDKSVSNYSNNEKESGEASVSEDEGLKSAESVFKAERDKDEANEDKEFLKYLKNRQKAKDLGLDEPRFATYYQGGVHFTNSNVENHGNVVGNDQEIHSNIGAGGFSGEASDKSSDKEISKSIEEIFDRCEDVKQRSFIIALAALNGCNYRLVVEASQRLQTILQHQAEVVQKYDV